MQYIQYYFITIVLDPSTKLWSDCRWSPEPTISTISVVHQVMAYNIPSPNVIGVNHNFSVLALLCPPISELCPPSH